MKTFKPLILFCIIFFSFLTACKKDKTQEQHCKILTVTTDVGNYAFTYDANGRYSTISRDNKVVRYEYSGSTVIVNATINGTFFHKITATLNDYNMPVSIRLEKNTTGTEWNNYFMEYNGEQLTRRTDTYHDGSTPRVVNYTWANGNMVSTTSSSGTTNTITYDESKASQTADFLSIAGLLSDDGFIMIKNRNVLSSFNGMPVTYTFDANNNIVSANIGSAATYNYQYTCN